LVILGPNGAGKTTTVRMLTSILCPTRGRAWVAGYDVTRDPEKVRASVGVLTEHHGLYGRMNAEEYLEFFSRLYGVKRSDFIGRRDELLDRFGLAVVRRKRLAEYSKGMRQKLALIRAMIHNPPVLLLDEPTSAMDPESARMVRDAILTLRGSERTIILCTHNLAEAEELADQVAIIRRGKILLNDTTERLKQSLLGPPEYEAELAELGEGFDSPDIELESLPEGVAFIGRTGKGLRFKVESPGKANPLLIRCLLDANIPVVSFREVSRSLEQAYMVAVTRTGETA
jgi:ABC-2 type transport system ATP-binding protein